MTANLVARVTSPKWLREAAGSRLRDFVNGLSFQPQVIDRTVAGETYRFRLGSPTGKSWYGSPVDASLEMAFVRRRMVRPGDCVVECGAHHGAQTILLSRWVGPEGLVVAVEPHPENFRILEENIALNDLRNVVAVRKALGAGPGSLAMAARSNASVRRRGGGTFDVEADTLDAVMDRIGRRPDLVKVDVEGFEYDLFEGARAVLAGRPMLFVEVHTLALARYGRAFADLWNYVDPGPYEVFIQPEDDQEPHPFAPGSEPRDRVHLFFVRRPSA